MNIELGLREAAALRQSLYLQTKDDSFEFPSERVRELRGIILKLDSEIEVELEKQQDTKDETTNT